jgi:hypothetical protein
MNTLDLRVCAPSLISGIHSSRVEELRQAWGRPIHLWPSRNVLAPLITLLKKPTGILRLGFAVEPLIKSGTPRRTERQAAMTAGWSGLALLGR